MGCWASASSGSGMKLRLDLAARRGSCPLSSSAAAGSGMPRKCCLDLVDVERPSFDAEALEDGRRPRTRRRARRWAHGTRPRSSARRPRARSRPGSVRVLHADSRDGPLVAGEGREGRDRPLRVDEPALRLERAERVVRDLDAGDRARASRARPPSERAMPIERCIATVGLEPLASLARRAGPRRGRPVRWYPTERPVAALIPE